MSPIAATLAQDAGVIDGPARSYCQYVVLRVPAELDEAALSTIMAEVTRAHPMLRAQTTTLADGVWRVEVRENGDDEGPATVCGVSTAPARTGLVAVLNLAAARLQPSAGRCWDAVLLPGEVPRLLLAVHHLSVDAVSWRVLVEDLQRAWALVAAGEPVRVPAEETSFGEYVTAQAQAARGGEVVRRELAHWRAATTARPADAVGSRGAAAAPGAVASWSQVQQWRQRLPESTTRALLSVAPRAYRATVNDLMLAALGLALGRTDTGLAPVVELEGHGREELTPFATPDDAHLDVDGAALDLSRTVGWFTSAFPVRLPDTSVPTSEGGGLTEAVKAVHEQLGAVAGHGIGYGMLRHQHPAGERLLGPEVTPAIGFNYLGRFAVGRPTDDWALECLEELETLDHDEKSRLGLGVIGTGTAPELPVRHVLGITAATEDGPAGPVLVAEWLWPEGALARETVAVLGSAWAVALADLVHRDGQPGQRDLTPADVPLVTIDRADATRLAAAHHPVVLDRILPLTATQRGLFFQHCASERPDPYVLQVRADLVGPLDVPQLERAIAQVVSRHPALRATFDFTGDGVPVAVHPESVEVTGGLVLEGPLAQAPDALARAEREAGFDLRQGPGLRWRLARIGPDRHHFVLTLHHILVDGWSMPLVVGDVLRAYRGEALPARPDPEIYLRWMSARPERPGLRAWANALAGLPGPTLLAGPGPDGATVGPAGDALGPDIAVIDVVLPEATRTALDALVSGHGLTVGTVVHVAWASMLAEETGRSDVLFGSVASVRPPELDGALDMVGMLLATTPLRVRRADPLEDAVGMMRRIALEQAELREHAHLPLARVLATHPTLAGVGEPFDTVVVLENIPATALDGPVDDRLRIVDTRVHDGRHFPFSLVADPGDRLRMRVEHDRHRVDPERAARLVGRFVQAVDELAAGRVPAGLQGGPGDPGGPGGPGGPETVPVDSPFADAGPGELAAPPADPAVVDAVCAAFAATLRLEHVGPDDNFFLLGGDSIGVIHVVTALRDRGVSITPAAVFAHPVPRSLACHLDMVGRRTEAASGPVSDVLTLSDAELDDLDAELGFV